MDMQYISVNEVMAMFLLFCMPLVDSILEFMKKNINVFYATNNMTIINRTELDFLKTVS